MGSDREKLKKLIAAGHPCISITTREEKDALEVIRNLALESKLNMLLWSAGKGLRNGLLRDVDTEKDTEHPAAALCKLVDTYNRQMCVMLDLAGHLSDKITLRCLRDAIEWATQTASTLILIDSLDELPQIIRAHSTPFALSLPDEGQLNEIIRTTLKEHHYKNPIDIGVSRKGYQAVIKNLRGLTRRQARQLIVDAIAEDRRFDDADINHILAGKRQLLSGDGLLEYVETPVTLDDIGGMNNLKQWLRLRKSVFERNASAYGLQAPRGILILGVQGAGKSLCAKAVATAWQQPLLRLEPGDLYAKYIGESERNLRAALQQAQAMAPVVLWIDEIEKAFASAAAQSSDGGLSKRMFGSLLTWMQEHREPVFVIATANDIEALPPELLRKGRFDEIFFVGLPNKAARNKIFQIHLSKRNQEPNDFDVNALASSAEGYSGAEIDWLCHWAKGRTVPAN